MRIIAGPCQHESLEQSMTIATECKRICDKYGVEYYFKASYDKANRTHISSKRGMGLHETVRDFLSMKDQISDLKIVTDVHEIDHIQYLKDIVDVLQIPAFMCRQTDLIQAVCATDCIVNIKKGQFLAPWDVKGILSKTENAKEVWITERGTSFGYNRLVVDFTGLHYMLEHYPVDIVLDGTHSSQNPGGAGDSSSGNRAYVPGLVRAGAALGISNFFLEVHPDPDKSPSDGESMLELKDFESVVLDAVKYSYGEDRWVNGKSDDYNIGYTDGISSGYEMGHGVGRYEGVCDTESDMSSLLKDLINSFDGDEETQQVAIENAKKILDTINGKDK